MAIPNPYGSLGTIWAEMGLDYSRFDQGTAAISTRTIELERLTQQSLDRMSEQWARFGARMSLAVTTPLMATATQMTWAFATFEQSMARTAAVAQATEAEFAAMQRTARELGATTQFTAQQAAEGMQFLAMAGFDATQTIEAMPGVLQLAASAQLDLATAADITTNILTGYGLAIEELARVNDVLVSAMTGANTNLQQLGEAMKYAGPVASAAGLEFEESAAALALMGNAGIQASMAGTSLRGAVTRLLNPTGQVRDLIRDLGLDIYDANGNLRSMVEIIAELERAQVSAGDMMALFGQRAGPAMQALVDQGSAALAEFVDRLRDSEGVAERIARMQEDTLAGSLRALRSAYDELALTLAGTVAPTLREIIEGATQAVRWFADLPAPVQQTTVAVAGLAAAIGPLSIGLSMLMRSLAVLSGPAGLIMAAAGAAASLGIAYASAIREQERFYDNALDTARALRDQADELDSLVRRYEDLSGKPERSSEEHDELEQVMRRIVEIQPEIAAGYDDISEAIERNIDPLRRYTDALRMQSETELMAAALRAQHDIEHLRAERDRLNAELADLRERLGPEYERAMLIVERSARAQQLYNEALQRMREGAPEAEALRPLREFFAEFAAPGANVPTVLARLEQEARDALIPFGRTADQIISLEGDIASLNDRIAMAERVIKVYTEGWDALEDSAGRARETIIEPVLPVMEPVEDLLDDLYALLAEEQALWQARVALARYGARDVIDQFGSVENVIMSYLQWLDNVIADESLDEVFRGRMADATRSAIRELERLQADAAAGLGDMAEMTAEEIARAVMTAVDRYGPAAERLRRAMAVGELPFIGDDLDDMERRIENFYRNMVETGRVGVHEHLQVLSHQLRELERAGEVGSDAWLRLAREIRGALNQIAEDEEQARRQSLQAAIEEAEHKARLYEWSAAQQADALQHVLDTYEATEEERLQLTRRIAELRAQYEREEIQRRERSEEDARRKAVQDAVAHARFLAQLHDWNAEQQANALEEALRTVDATAEEEADILRQIELLRAQHARQEASRQQRIRRENLQAAFEEARFLAQLYDWTREQYITALEQILEDHEDVADERLRIERELALERKRLAEEAAEAERQALRQAHADAARVQIAQARATEQSIAALQQQKVALMDLALHYLTLGEEGSEALKLIDEALQETQRRLDEAIASHPAVQFVRQLEGVLAGRRAIGEVGMAWIDQQAGDAAARVIDDLSARTARFIDLTTSGAMEFQSAWEAAFRGMSISAKDAFTLILAEIIRMFTAAEDARRRLQEQGRIDAERRMEDEKRFARLTALGFVGEFETTTKRYTERVSYLFGLFHKNVHHSEQVTSERTKEWLERMEQLWADAQRKGQSAMQEAFRAPETAQLATFYRSLNVGVYESVRDGLINAFTESQAYAHLMAPLWQTIDEGIEAAFAGGAFDPDRFWRMVEPALEQFQQEVELLEFPFREIQNVIREIEDMLGIPSEAARGMSGGTRLAALSGEQRDFFAELMRPVRYLDQMPQQHAEHMRRLDEIIGLLSAGDTALGTGFAAYIEQQQATLHASEIIVEHIASATFTGPVTLLADGQDIRTAFRQIMDEEYAAGAAAGRGTGL